MNDIIAQLNWRYAVKKYDAGQRLSPENITLLQEAIRLAPSSHGLQPYKVLFIEDPVLRAKLREASYGQPQITEASVLVIFAIETRVDDHYIDAYFERLCQIRDVPLEGNVLHHKHSILASLNRMTVEEKAGWATNQAYLALGGLLYVAAQLGIDTNPMEGFMPGRYDEILGLAEEGLRSVVIAGVGTRHPEDVFQHFKKVRKPASALFINRK